MPDLCHYLVVTEEEGERDLNVEHDDACPFDDADIGFGVPVRYYRCDVGNVVALDGLECAPQFAELAPGRYPIEAWSEPGRWYGADYSDPDGGLRLVESDD